MKAARTRLDPPLRLGAPGRGPLERSRATTARTCVGRRAHARRAARAVAAVEGAMTPRRSVVHPRAARATLRPGQIVVLDNLSAHKADSIRQAIEAAAATCSSCRPTRPTSRPSSRPSPRSRRSCAAWGAHQETLQEAVRLAVAAITRTMPPLGSPMLATLCLLKLPESCSRFGRHERWGMRSQLCVVWVVSDRGQCGG